MYIIKTVMATILLLWFQAPGIVHNDSLSHCHGLRGHLNRTEPALLVRPVLACCNKLKCLLWKKRKTAPKLNQPWLMGDNEVVGRKHGREHVSIGVCM